MNKIKDFFKKFKFVFMEVVAIIVMAVLLTMLITLLCFNNAHCQSNNKDWVSLDSTFRAMEARKGGGSNDFKNRIFNISQSVNGPRRTGDVKVFTIDNLILKGAGLYCKAADINDAGVQTNRTFLFHSLNI